MLISVIKQFKWVDIAVIILLFRIFYIAMKRGFFAELFKLLGILTGIYLAAHYYVLFSDFIRQKVEINQCPLEFFDFFIFALFAVGGYGFFALLRTLISRFVKMEAVHLLDKWGGVLVGVVRSFLFAGLMMFILVISSVPYLKKSVQDSYLGSRFFPVVPQTYSWQWNNLMSKFMTWEKFNSVITEVQDGFLKK